jgi:hypothetical protein
VQAQVVNLLEWLQDELGVRVPERRRCVGADPGELVWVAVEVGRRIQVEEFVDPVQPAANRGTSGHAKT